uniref:Uncharacterized protein n=1 Tax=Manihot esculenta TaxID=3983 RepID=A0A2C9VC93_MANES
MKFGSIAPQALVPTFHLKNSVRLEKMHKENSLKHK